MPVRRFGNLNTNCLVITCEGLQRRPKLNIRRNFLLCLDASPTEFVAHERRRRFRGAVKMRSEALELNASVLHESLNFVA